MPRINSDPIDPSWPTGISIQFGARGGRVAKFAIIVSEQGSGDATAAAVYVYAVRACVDSEHS